MNSSDEQPQTLPLPDPSPATGPHPRGPEETPARLTDGGELVRVAGQPGGTAQGSPGTLASLAPGEVAGLEPLFTAPFGPSIPGYEILGELGRGGMGVVYKARHTRLNRLVALKMILGESADGDSLLRFQGEAEAVAQLAHPNIVQVYEVGEHHGQPYFSLEFVAGGSLDRYLKSTPQPPRASAGLVRVLALAMQTAHDKDIVHRDLKPANVLLQMPNDQSPLTKGEGAAPLGVGLWSLGIPKITDFGLAKKLTEEAGQTISGAVMGTPSYMAPEQAEGRLKDIDARSDVWALGAILYEMLTGRPPFKGASVLDTLEQIRSQDPVAPSRLTPNLPRDVETICLKCLQKRSANHYPSARALADDLERYLDHKPISARPVSAWERTRKWAQRRPAQAALVVALFLVVLAGSAGGLFYGLYQEQQATAVRQRLERSRLVQEGWTQGQIAETAGQYLRAKQYYDEALATLDADADPADADLRRRLAEGRARVLRKLEDESTRREAAVRRAAQREDFQKRSERFGQHRDQVLFHAVSFHDQDAANDAAVVRREAPAALAELGLSANQPEELGAGLTRWRAAVDDPKQLDRLASDCYEVLLVWAEGEAALTPKTALRLLDGAAVLGRVHGLANPRAFHLRRGRILERLGDRDGGRAEQQHAAAIPMHSVVDHFQAGLESYRKGQYEAAAASCEEVLGKEGDHFWGQYLKALCNAQAKPPRWDLAKVSLATCVARRPGSPALLLLLGAAHAELGAAVARKGQGAAAGKEFTAAHDVFRRALDRADTPSLRAAVLTGRSALHIHQGHWDEARRDLLKAIELQPKAYQGYVNLAQAYQSRGDLDAAVGALDSALGLHRAASLYNMRARLQMKRGKTDLARGDFEQIIAREPAAAPSARLAGAHVELAHLDHLARKFDLALAHCEAALVVLPEYAAAHRQRAETLVALEKYDRAGKALDRYLAGRTRDPIFYRARGMIHFRRGEYARAVDLCTRAIQMKPHAQALRYRGWSYLALEAPRLALPDFEAALRLEKKNANALCGRGLAAVQLIQPRAKPAVVAKEVRAAATDADEALRLTGERTVHLLMNCARVHARAAGVLEAAGDPAADGRKAIAYQERALRLLRDALEQVPAADRAAFWRASIRPDPALQAIRNTAGLLRLAQLYAR